MLKSLLHICNVGFSSAIFSLHEYSCREPLSGKAELRPGTEAGAAAAAETEAAAWAGAAAEAGAEGGRGRPVEPLHCL